MCELLLTPAKQATPRLATHDLITTLESVSILEDDIKRSVGLLEKLENLKGAVETPGSPGLADA